MKLVVLNILHFTIIAYTLLLTQASNYQRTEDHTKQLYYDGDDGDDGDDDDDDDDDDDGDDDVQSLNVSIMPHDLHAIHRFKNIYLYD